MVQEIVDAVATAATCLEESAYPDAVILSNFPRSLQLDGHSCGAKSVYTILKYFGKRCPLQAVENELHTTYWGTARNDIKRVLKRLGLKYQKIQGLKSIKDILCSSQRAGFGTTLSSTAIPRATSSS